MFSGEELEPLVLQLFQFRSGESLPLLHSVISMKLIGLTGGIGSGKSKAAEILNGFGFPVIDTDELARQLVAVGEPALGEIEKKFGPDILLPGGGLDRSKLARVVFGDPDRRRALESILHPRIRGLWDRQADLWRKEGRSAGVVVIPLLFETDSAAAFDAVICVACSAPLQRERLKLRGWTVQESAHRISSQWPVERKIGLATFVVWNESSIAILEAQLRRILGSAGLTVPPIAES